MTPTAIFIYGPDPTERVGGGARYVCAHARAAVRAGLETHLFCHAARSAVEACDFGTVHRVRSPVRPFRNLMASLHAPFVTRALTRFLEGRAGPHVLHAFAASAGVAIHAAATGVRRGIACTPVVSVWDGLYEESVAKLAGVDPSLGLRGKINPAIEVAWNAAVMRGYERRNFRRCEAVYVNYRSIERLVVSGYAVDPARVHFMPYASETAFLPPDNAPPPEPIADWHAAGVPLIVVMSRHVPRKGLPVLLRALAELRTEGRAFRACFVGGGYLLDYHRRLADGLGLGDVVRIVGHVPESFDYVRRADLFVLPSLEEGSGSMSVIEALQAGVAVIATRIDGIPEDLTDGENAVLVSPDDVRDLRDAVRRLLEDSGLRRRLGERGRQRFLERFSADALTRGLVEAYRQLGVPFR